MWELLSVTPARFTTSRLGRSAAVKATGLQYYCNADYYLTLAGERHFNAYSAMDDTDDIQGV